ncbi:50S ribosomal protein L25/general stress protein Ctc [Burkholderiaceae bacterium DAT-1]|nr:50S ribosomal protein L25/general stress protein Ctc [Burkholderiaceae bacterium DAT-1]
MEVIAKTRTLQGTGASRRLRKDGVTPGIVYGAGQGPVSIELNHKDLYHAMQKEEFHASVLSLVVDGKAEPVLLRDAQYHPWKQIVLHVDFQRVDPNAKLHIRVPFHFLNEDNAVGVKTGGGKISHVTVDAEISCLPGKLPKFIEVDVLNLEAGHSVHLSDIKLPEGVEFVALAHGDNATVVSIIAPKGAAA